MSCCDAMKAQRWFLIKDREPCAGVQAMLTGFVLGRACTMFTILHLDRLQAAPS